MSSFEQLLRPGERILWTGAPRQGLMLTGADLFLIPFSLLWGGFAICWEAIVLVTDTEWFMKLWGVPFVLIGLYLIVGRFFVDAWARGGIRYVLTDQRALVERTRFGYALNSIELAGKEVRLTSVRGDGRGTIEFGSGLPIWSPFAGRSAGWGRWAPWVGGSEFEGIENARDVFAKVLTVTGRMV